MTLRFLNPTLHGIADYLAGVGLLTMPFILGLGSSAPLAKWLAVATGAAVIAASLLTDYRYGALRVLPFKGHLVVDTLVAIGFAAAPTVFGFAGLDAWYYWVNSAAVFLVVGVSHTGEQSLTAAQSQAL